MHQTLHVRRLQLITRISWTENLQSLIGIGLRENPSLGRYRLSARRGHVDVRCPVVPVPDDLMHVGSDEPDLRITEPVASNARSLNILAGKYRLTDIDQTS